MTRLLPAILLVGCSQYSYVSAMERQWSGTGLDAVGQAKVVTANLIYDEEPLVPDQYFTGYVELDTWIYDVYDAYSDKDYAQVGMFHNAGARKLDLIDVVVDRKEDEMSGTWQVNVCYQNRVPQEGQDPAACITTGTFTMTRNGPPIGATGATTGAAAE